MIPALGRTRSTALLLTAIVLLGTVPGPALAAERAGDTVVVEEGETVDDLQAFGGSVVVRGTVDGDLQAFGGSVEIAESGTVTGDVEASAGDVEIAGTVDGNVQIAGGNVVVAEGATVGGDFEGGAGTVRIAGTIEGDVRVGADSVRLTEAATIGGDVEYDAEDFRNDATVEGTVTRNDDLSVGFEWAPFVGIPNWIGAVYGFLVNLAFGAVLLALLPRFSNRVAERAISGPLSAGAIGFASLIAVPLLLVVIALTIVGIPLTIVGALLFVVLAWAGAVYSQFGVGVWLLSLADAVNRWAALLVGVLVVSLIGLAPLLGGVVQFLVFLVGLGALIAHLVSWRRSGRADASGI